jgi:hypothetical protein
VIFLLLQQLKSHVELVPAKPNLLTQNKTLLWLKEYKKKHHAQERVNLPIKLIQPQFKQIQNKFKLL